MKTFKTQLDECPKCHAALDAATSVGHTSAPEEGSITICLQCGGIASWDHELRLQRMSRAEFAALDDAVRNRVMHTKAALWDVRQQRAPTRAPTKGE